MWYASAHGAWTNVPSTWRWAHRAWSWSLHTADGDDDGDVDGNEGGAGVVGAFVGAFVGAGVGGTVHCDAPDALPSPGAQAVHASSPCMEQPAALNRPAGQFAQLLHVLPAFPNVLGQSTWFPTWYWPAPHP